MSGPVFSLVVPTCDRPAALAELLERLRPERLSAPPDSYELIVSDDGVTGAAAEIVRTRFPGVRFYTGPRRGPAANRNYGASRAAGTWLVFVDDDCQPAAGWLRAIAAEVAGRPLDVVEGKIVAPDKKTSLFRRDVENLHGDCFWSANLAVRREFFERIGGFDEDFLQAGGEDLELAHRFRTCGARTAFCPDAVISHPSHLMTWRGLLEFTFRIRWHALYLLKTRQTMPDDTPLWRIVPHVIASRTIQLVRTTTRHLKAARHQPAILATVVFEWALFPIVLPYLIYWHAHFLRVRRERLARRVDSGGTATV
jgi:GT2 family glycosyltransferase